MLFRDSIPSGLEQVRPVLPPSACILNQRGAAGPAIWEGATSRRFDSSATKGDRSWTNQGSWLSLPLPALIRNLLTKGNFRASHGSFQLPHRASAPAVARHCPIRTIILPTGPRPILLISFYLSLGPYSLFVLQSLRGHLCAFCMVSTPCTRSESVLIGCTSIHDEVWRFWRSRDRAA